MTKFAVTDLQLLMIKLIFIVVNVLLAFTTIAYPIVWLLADSAEILTILPLIMSLFWGLKALGQKCQNESRGKIYFSLFMTALLALVYLARQQNSLYLMYWYPVLMNVVMLVLFGGSLFSSQSLIERLARLQTPNLSDEGIQYTRKVTQLWCGVFIINILITSGLILLKFYQLWAIYSGIIAYMIMAVVMTGEWLVRQKVKRGHSQ